MRYTITLQDVRVAQAELQPHPGDVAFLNGFARALEGYDAVRAAAEAAHTDLVGSERTGAASVSTERAAAWDAAFAELELRDHAGHVVHTEFLHLLADPASNPADIWVIARQRQVNNDVSAA